MSTNNVSSPKRRTRRCKLIGSKLSRKSKKYRDFKTGGSKQVCLQRLEKLTSTAVNLVDLVHSQMVVYRINIRHRDPTPEMKYKYVILPINKFGGTRREGSSNDQNCVNTSLTALVFNPTGLHMGVDDDWCKMQIRLHDIVPDLYEKGVFKYSETHPQRFSYIITENITPELNIETYLKDIRYGNGDWIDTLKKCVLLFELMKQRKINIDSFDPKYLVLVNEKVKLNNLQFRDLIFSRPEQGREVTFMNLEKQEGLHLKENTSVKKYHQKLKRFFDICIEIMDMHWINFNKDVYKDHPNYRKSLQTHIVETMKWLKNQKKNLDGFMTKLSKQFMKQESPKQESPKQELSLIPKSWRQYEVDSFQQLKPTHSLSNKSTHSLSNE